MSHNGKDVTLNEELYAERASLEKQFIRALNGGALTKAIAEFDARSLAATSRLTLKYPRDVSTIREVLRSDIVETMTSGHAEMLISHILHAGGKYEWIRRIPPHALSGVDWAAVLVRDAPEGWARDYDNVFAFWEVASSEVMTEEELVAVLCCAGGEDAVKKIVKHCNLQREIDVIIYILGHGVSLWAGDGEEVCMDKLRRAARLARIAIEEEDDLDDFDLDVIADLIEQSTERTWVGVRADDTLSFVSGEGECLAGMAHRDVERALRIIRSL